MQSATTIPSFHDGCLTGIVLGETSATLGLRRSDGSDYELELIGVEALHVMNLRQGNIVSALEIVSSCDPAGFHRDDWMERLFPAPHPDAAELHHKAHASFLASRMARIVSGEAALVMLTPSYGCDLAAFCADVALRPKCVANSR